MTSKKLALKIAILLIKWRDLIFPPKSEWLDRHQNILRIFFKIASGVASPAVGRHKISAEMDGLLLIGWLL